MRRQIIENDAERFFIVFYYISGINLIYLVKSLHLESKQVTSF